MLRPDVLREVTSSENHAKAELAARERFLETLKKVRTLSPARLWPHGPRCSLCSHPTINLPR